MPTPVKYGDEFQVNTETEDAQNQAVVAGLANGQFAVAFRDLSRVRGGGQDSSILVQVFNADGSKAGREITIDDGPEDWWSEPAIAALDDGRFVVSFTEQLRDAINLNVSAIRAVVLNSDGSAPGPNFLVKPLKFSEQYDSAVAALSNGRFVVTYSDESYGRDDGRYAIRAQILASDGSMIGREFRINSTTLGTQVESSVAALEGGGFVVLFTYRGTSANVLGQVFDSRGNKLGNEFAVDSPAGGYNSSVCALANGGFVVVFQNEVGGAGDKSGRAVRGQAFNPDGTKSGEVFLVNTVTDGDQQDPSVAALPDGRFVVVYADSSETMGDDHFEAVLGQVFNADGTKSGDEFLVNTTTYIQQRDPSVSVMADGRFVVVFRDDGFSDSDTSNGLVRGQMFDPRIEAVVLRGSTSSDDYIGTKFNDVMRGFLGNDQLAGGAGEDRLDGGGEDDRLYGDDGDDMLKGGTGADRIAGGAGVDTAIYARSAEGISIDLKTGFGSLGDGAGDKLSSVENLIGSAFADELAGNSSTNTLDGRSGDDGLKGGDGNDELLGGRGNDILTGGMGRDILRGGGGSDVFDFDHPEESSTGNLRDRIVDFSSGRDRIDLSTIDANSIMTEEQIFVFIGASSFSGTPGELRFNNGVISADVDGDTLSDFQLDLLDAALLPSDLLL